MGRISPHGLVSYAADGSPTYLPLRSVSVKIHIVDVSARVVVKQHYINVAANNASTSAKYIFPVPATGAVCVFKMRSANGRVVQGVVKERSIAEKEYEFAISQNQFAGLVYEATPDIFVISIGAIPKGQDVEVTIMYVVPLSDGDLPGYDQIQFILPTYVATRYGPPPAALTSPSSSTTHTTLDICAEIQMPSPITSVSSSSHAIKVHTTNTDSKSVYTSYMTLDPAGPPPTLNRDFVLDIQAERLGHPRCVAEVLEPRVETNSTIQTQQSIALSLSLIPRLKIPVLPSQEYIFLVDRSGSMGGSRIQHAKDALMLLLKSLPVREGTSFNVASFGSTSSMLWNASHACTARDVVVALTHVKAMDADMGGTEIEDGVRNTLRSRNTSVPTSIFLLTDGEVYNIDSLLALVSSEVAMSHSHPLPTSSPYPPHLRFFTLGIGDAASTALCAGVARAGNGICLLSTDAAGADVAQKCARLLSASVVAPVGWAAGGTGVGEVQVDWGHVPRSASAGGKERAVQQAPSRIPQLYPANRLTVYAILYNTSVVPREVTLRGTLPDGSAISLPPIPVCLSLEQRGFGHGKDTLEIGGALPPLIHTLAAHRIIQELEDEMRVDSVGATSTSSVFDSVNKGKYKEKEKNTKDAKDAIVQLSEKYQLASKFASFIAVEEGGDCVDEDDEDDNDNRGGGVDGDDDNDDNFYTDDEDEKRARHAGHDNANANADVNISSKSNANVNKANTSPGGNAQAHGSLASALWPGVEPPSSQRHDHNATHGYGTSHGQSVTHAQNTYSRGHGVPGLGAGVVSDSALKGAHNPSSSSGWPGAEPLARSASVLNSNAHSITFWPRKVDMSGEPHVGVPSSLHPLGVGGTALGDTSTSVTGTAQHSPHFINVFKPPGPNASGPGASHRTNGSIAIQRSANTRSEREVYFLETVSNIDSQEEIVPSRSTSSKSSAGNGLVPGAYLGRAEKELPVPPSKPRVWDTDLLDSGCPGRRVPGEYPHGCCCCCCCCCRRKVDCHDPAPVPRLRRSNTMLTPRPILERPQSILYELETAACSESLAEPFSSTAVLGTWAEDEAEDEPKGAHAPIFNVTASSKTGVYKVPRKPVAIAPTQWTTGVPIIAAARLQNIDGSFELTDELLHAVIGNKITLQRLKSGIPARLRSTPNAERIWATVLAAAYLKKVLGEDKEVWIGLWNNAADYVEGRLGKKGVFSALVDEAARLL